MKIRKIISLLLCLALILTLAACGNKPVETAKTEEERVVITRGVSYVESNDNNKYHSPRYGYPDITISRNEIYEPLNQKLIEYKGMDVWFRVYLVFENDALYNQLALKATEKLKVYMEKIVAEEIEFAKSIGAMNVMKPEETVSCSNFMDIKYYYMELTAEMIDKLYDRGRVSIDLAPPQRVDGYSDKISDTLTAYLEKMDHTDELEVAVVIVYDGDNSYAFRQNIGANMNYNKKYFKLLVPDTEMLTSKKTAEKIKEIVQRLGMQDKRIIRDEDNIQNKEYLPEETPAGFNVILTKAEILKLAEDSEVKVIYAAAV